MAAAGFDRNSDVIGTNANFLLGEGAVNHSRYSLVQCDSGSVRSESLY